MTKRKGRRGDHRPAQQRRRHLSVVPSRPAGDEDQARTELIRNLRTSLRSDEPLDLLMTVSGLLTATDERQRDPFRKGADHANRDDLLASFVATDYTETTATLAVMRALLADESQAQHVGRELTTRRQPLPPWIHGLKDARLEPEVWFLGDELGDGDDYILGLTLPTGHSLSALVYVDQNLGGVVKDAFVVPTPLAEVTAHVASLKTEGVQPLAHTNPADARATIEEAIAHGSLLYPQPESDTWPLCRPLVEWMVRMLPVGGAAPARREWSPDALQTIARDFFSSPFGVPVDSPEGRDLLESILWFGSDYTAGDPLRWSPVSVELLLVDWFPRKIVAEAAFLARMPDVLRAFIVYCHDQRGIRPRLTAETLAAVSTWEPDYQRAIRTDRLQGAEALLAHLVPGFGDQEDDGLEFGSIMLAGLEDRVGGRIQLMNLSAEPLPDEAFGWDGIADNIRPVIEQMLAECDRVADELLGVEYRTAMRRLLGRIAVGDPALFRRKASPVRGAAAVAWLVHRANEEATSGQLLVQDLLAAFGLNGSVAQRAEPMLRAIGIDPHARLGWVDLGAGDLLTSETRAAIIRWRDFYLEFDDDL